MIDLDELHDKMVSYRLVGFTKSDIGTIDALELLGRLGQAEKDAARYRWLRDVAPEVDFESPLAVMADEYGCVIGADNYCEILFSDRLDAAIDEAMRCNK